MAAHESAAAVTLVLGAGVSHGLAPDWNAFTEDVERACGVEPGAAASGAPNQNQARLELAWRQLRERLLQAPPPDATVSAAMPVGWRMTALEAAIEGRWVELMREALYANREHPFARARVGPRRAAAPPATLGSLVRWLTRDDNTVVQRVVTFNADDWLEYALARQLGPEGFRRRFRVVSQPTAGVDALSLEADAGGELLSQRKVPIVHAHGLLCHPAEGRAGTATYATPNRAGRRPSLDAPNALVFRDLDYWRMTATPASFANQMVLAALSTSRCVFVGLSMRDLNLLRWLGTIAAEHEAAWRERWLVHFRAGDESLAAARAWRGRGPRHLWLEGAPDPVLRRLLSHRGIEALPTDWRATSGPTCVDARLEALLHARPAARAVRR
ncbi:MAG: SIR2 family protein [Myxococcaceae bacterium]|nr:SIR2 family protein [Myxococcaceae bacterium]MCA3016838.1 SIR2 family protein [Myxococcaceae bacterium]